MNLWIFIIGELLWISLTVTCDESTTNATTKATPDLDKIPVTCIIRENVADCSYDSAKVEGGRLLETFPNNVVQKRASLESLDISQTVYQGANIAQFSHLTRLVARTLQITNTTFNTLLLNIQKLESLVELDLSGTHRSNASDIEADWPSRISKLSLSNMGLESVKKLIRLDRLQELDLSMNNLKRLPKLNPDAPLALINLRDNDISHMTVEEIAPFCELTALRMDDKGNFTAATNYRYCAALQKWTTEYLIETDSLQCYKPTSGEIPNSIPFSSRALKTRQDCLAALPSTSVFELLLYAVFFSVLFPLLYFANEAYQRYQSNKQTAVSTSVKKRRKRKGSTTGSDVELETADNVDDTEPEESESEKLSQSFMKNHVENL